MSRNQNFQQGRSGSITPEQRIDYAKERNNMGNWSELSNKDLTAMSKVLNQRAKSSISSGDDEAADWHMDAMDHIASILDDRK